MLRIINGCLCIFFFTVCVQPPAVQERDAVGVKQAVTEGQGEP